MTVPATMELPEQERTPLKITAVITIILGIVALVVPYAAGIAATYFLAANFVIAGVLMSICAFRATGWAGALGLMALGIISLLAGIIIFAHPLIGLATVTLFAIAGMFVAGIAKIAWTFMLPSGSGRWFLLISGLLSIAVAAMVYSRFPSSAEWFFGVLIGINLLMEGISLWVFVQAR